MVWGAVIAAAAPIVAKVAGNVIDKISGSDKNEKNEQTQQTKTTSDPTQLLKLVNDLVAKTSSSNTNSDTSGDILSSATGLLKNLFA